MVGVSALVDVELEELTEEEAWAVFDKYAMTHLGISGAEFREHWLHGKYLDNEEPAVNRVAMLMPSAW